MRGLLALNALLDRPDLWSRYKGGVFELGATLRKTENELELIRSQIEGIDPEDNSFIKAFDAMIAKVKDFNLEIEENKKDDPLGTKTMSESVSAFVDGLGSTNDAISNLTINTMKKFEDTLIEGLKNGKLAFELGLPNIVAEGNFMADDFIVNFESLKTEETEKSAVWGLYEETTSKKVEDLLHLLGVDFQKKGFASLVEVDGDVCVDGSEFEGYLFDWFRMMVGGLEVGNCYLYS